MEYTVMNNDGTKMVYTLNSVDSKYIDTYYVAGNIKPLYYDVSREVIFYFIFCFLRICQEPIQGKSKFLKFYEVAHPDPVS